MTRLLYGPPGCGKTTTLVQLFIDCAKVSGPEKVAAITFTRAGADELRQRLAARLEIHGTPSQIKRRLPYVGTIHSLCFRRTGSSHEQMVTQKRLAEFCEALHIEAPAEWLQASDYVPEELDEPYLDKPNFRSKEVELMVWADAAAKHRLRPFEEGMQLIEQAVYERVGTHADRLKYLKHCYDRWKAAGQLLDYQDLLEEGLKVSLPVHTLLVDEVQDNSPLLASVADAWGYARGVVNFALAGDPYQALYGFAGGNPGLFLGHEGTWHTIGNSHRLSEASAEYAKQVLWRVGWDDPKLETWRGVGGYARDGTVLHLARTNNLVYDLFERPMLDAGTPYRKFRGRAPLETNAASAFRFLHRLSQGEVQTGVDNLARVVHKSVLSTGVAARLQKMKVEVDAAQVEQLFGRPLRNLMENIPYGDYFQRLLGKHGVRGLYLQPRAIVSTIHGAKGREADYVVLARSWASRPAADAALDPRPESLCAYVAASRHRVGLTFAEGGSGIAYSFP